MSEPEVILKKQIHEAGYNYRDIAEHLSRPYGTITTWLNGFAPLPYDYRRRIEGLIKSKKKEVNVNS